MFKSSDYQQFLEVLGSRLKSAELRNQQRIKKVNVTSIFNYSDYRFFPNQQPDRERCAEFYYHYHYHYHFLQFSISHLSSPFHSFIMPTLQQQCKLKKQQTDCKKKMFFFKSLFSPNFHFSCLPVRNKTTITRSNYLTAKEKQKEPTKTK